MADRYSASPEYLENFSTLIRHIYRVALGSDEINSDAVEREIAAVVGRGKISATMLGRYIRGETKSELKPKTHLNFARFLQARDSNPRWGRDDQDALTALYDWLEYGPDGAPPNAPADRHKGRPTAEKIKAANSKILKSLSDAMPDMSTLEMLAAIEEMVEAIRYRLEDGGLESDSAPPAESICEDTKPLPTLLLVNMGLPRPVTDEAVNKLSQLTKLDEGRCKAILCGQMPTDDEVPNLAIAAKMPAPDLAQYIRISNALSLGNHESVA